MAMAMSPSRLDPPRAAILPTATSPAGSAGAVANDDEVITPSSLHGADPPGYVLINLDHLVNLTSLEDERWKRAHPEFWGQFVIEER